MVPRGRWAGLALSILAGALIPFGFAPYDQAWVFFISWTGLVWLLDGAAQAPNPAARTALLGWGFGFGQFAAGLYWIGAAFLVDAEVFGAIMVPAITALAAGLALFPACAGYLHGSARRTGPRRIIALAGFMGASEWLRGHILTGFPWNLPGQVFTFSDISIQAASLFGVDGLSFIAILIAAAPALLADGPWHSRRVMWPLAAIFSLTLGLCLFGTLRLTLAADTIVPDVHLRLVQPNIPQTEKWDPAFQRQVLEKLLDLSSRPGRPSHIIWPEAATPFILDRTPAALDAVADLLNPGKILLTGALRVDLDQVGRMSAIYNSLEVFNDKAELLASYDKSHLVPFGEYLPFRPIFELFGLHAIAAHLGETKAGSGPSLVFAPGLPPFSPLICYENVFSGAVAPANGGRPGFLLMVTNTAWFGTSIGPPQHFAQARLRAVEEGLPAVQVANAGISGVIDPYGRVKQRLELGAEGFLDSDLPAPVKPPLAGHAPIALILFLLLIIFL
jgi:apolipoprotein N-acyltransferase